MFQVEAPQERLPAHVDVRAGQRGGRGPQPQWLGIAFAGQVLDLQSDQCAVQDGQFGVGVLQPRAAALQARMHPVPGEGVGCAVAGGLGRGGGVGCVPGVGLGQSEHAAVAARAAAAGRGAGCAGVAQQHAVRAQPHHDLHGQVGQDVGQAGAVVAGVHDDEDVRIAVLPVAGGDDAVDDFAQLGGGDSGGVVGRSQAHGVQEGDPGGPSALECGHEGVRPARHQLVACPAASAVAVAEQPVAAGGCVGSQPVGDVHGQHDSPVRGSRQWQGGNGAAQSGGFEPARVQCGVHRAVPAPVLGRQAQLDQRLDRPVRAQQCVGEFEKRVTALVQAVVELDPKVGQQAQRGTCGRVNGKTHRQRPFSRTS